MIRMSRSFIPLALFSVAFVACGDDEEPEQQPACSVETQSGCDASKGLVCEAVEGGGTGCFAPVVVEGRVLDSADQKGIGGARVVARDINGAMASQNVAVSGADGAYKLNFPATRKSDGTPAVGQFTLRADALNYATFPSGLRTALPVDTAQVVKQPDNSYVVKNPSTDIALDKLPMGGLGTISGTVKGTNPGGTLVVAGNAGATNAPSGIAARDGTYTVFNVPAGSQEVRGYLQGLQLKPATATVAAGAETKGVDLLADSTALGTVTGDVSFVNAGSSNTSVILVVDETFNPTLIRGEVPKGLRVQSTGKYEFTGVPAGKYKVLAAFENDSLVRDPDTSIGGTMIQTITVAGGQTTVPGFKITGALAVSSPGAGKPEPVTTPPTLTWEDDSSEDGYEVVVYDTFGREVWRNKDVPRVTGSKTVTTTVAADAKFTPGQYYQFRAYSWKSDGGGRVYISSTEDLKGVFIAK
jgi:hypothetical protein